MFLINFRLIPLLLAFLVSCENSKVDERSNSNTSGDGTIELEEISDQSVESAEDVSSLNLSITSDDLDSNNLSFSVSSDNQSLLPDANITLQTSDDGTVVEFSPIDSVSGSATITISIVDSTTNEVVDSVTFVISVEEGNSAPEIDDVTDQYVHKGNSITGINLSASDEESSSQSFTWAASSNNQTLLPDANITLTPSGLAATVDLAPVSTQAGVATVTITITDNGTGSLSDSITFDLNVVGEFGLGTDGDLTVSSSQAIDAVTLSSGRTPSARGKVESISGQTITLNATFDDTSDFKIHDEIMWYVTSAGTTCTSDRGKYGFTLITAADGTAKTITVADTIGISPNDSARTAGTAFCSMQIIRVPQFNNLTISAAGTLTAPEYADTAATGGVLVLRVASTLSLNGNISAEGSGFAGSSSAEFQGEGIYGLGIQSDSPNGSSGGGSNDGGGPGGGNGGDGGDGDAAGTGGEAITECSSSSCLPSERLFFGGAGGSGESDPGHDGGGIVYISTNQISSTSKEISASGEAASATDGGTGAGGTVFLRMNDPGSDVFSLGAVGISPIDASAGSSGGGVVRYEYCGTHSNNANITIDVSAGAPSGGGAGSNGLSSSATNSDLCE